MARGIFCIVHRLIWDSDKLHKSSYIVIFAKYGPLLSHLIFAKWIILFQVLSRMPPCSTGKVNFEKFVEISIFDNTVECWCHVEK